MKIRKPWFLLNNKLKHPKWMPWWEFSTTMSESIKLTLDHHLTWFSHFHSMQTLSGLVFFLSAVCPFGTLCSSCLSDSFCTLIAAEKIHCASCLACAALNYLVVLPLAGKTASQQCPSSLGKDIHQHRPVFPLGACPFWCLLFSLIGSYSSKLCQGILEFFLRCIFSRMPRKSREHR